MAVSIAVIGFAHVGVCVDLQNGKVGIALHAGSDWSDREGVFAAENDWEFAASQLSFDGVGQFLEGRFGFTNYWCHFDFVGRVDADAVGLDPKFVVEKLDLLARVQNCLWTVLGAATIAGCVLVRRRNDYRLGRFLIRMLFGKSEEAELRCLFGFCCYCQDARLANM